VYMKKTVILTILDGFGHNPDKAYNAVAMANTPNFDYLVASYPNSLLKTCGEAVGLPEGQMGNSEVGHMTIGSGRVIFQDLELINRAVRSNELASHPILVEFANTLKQSGKRLHLMGLASSGGVHSHLDHMIAIYKIMTSYGVEVCFHAFSDGRDVSPHDFANTIQILKKENIPIASITGRFFVMDRDNRWERVQKFYDAVFNGNAPFYGDPALFIESCYKNEVTDEFIPPHITQGFSPIIEGEAILMCNFRSDRVRQILTAIADPNFSKFDKRHLNLTLVGMSPYSDFLDKKMKTLFPKQQIKSTLGEVLAQNGMKQFRVAETEKYPHVTFFFNCGREDKYEGEDRVMINSPKVQTYDLKPEMSAEGVCNEVIKALQSQAYDFICVNFANPDMVGHSGNLAATIKAVETVDIMLGRIIEKAKQNPEVEMLITADHGNAEQMFDFATNLPMTSHTLFDVPIIYFGNRNIKLRSGGLSDIAPTILELMCINKPDEMKGDSLVC
jgi:2,3-bisphosphoglycerate-independent phosphoglycerate mutase